MLVEVKVEMVYFPHDGTIVISVPDSIADDPHSCEGYINNTIKNTVFTVSWKPITRSEYITMAKRCIK